MRESLNISLASKLEEECLNLNSEWGGSKLPNLAVSVPKGVGKVQNIGAGNSGDSQGNENKGDKRTREPRHHQKGPEELEGRPGKKLRDKSPEEKGKKRWKQKPSFLKPDSGQETE